MLFLNWLRPSRVRNRTAIPGFRPALQYLEDRTVPSGMGWFGPIPGRTFDFGSGPRSTPGPATHLQVVVPESTQAGHSAYVFVEALDAANQIATGYTGSVSLSLAPPDATVPLPTAYTFSSSDHGVHLFQVTLATAGSETIDATGTLSSATITGAATTTVYTTTAPTITPTVAQVMIISPEQAATGVGTRVEVEALDTAGHLVRNFTGTVTLSSSDTLATGAPNHRTAAASLPITYTFTQRDHGEHTFLVTFQTAIATGSATTVSASTPGASGTVTGQATLTTYPPTVVTHFDVDSRGLVASGTATAVYVSALNASNQVVTGYTGTISFGSSDTTATAAATSGGTPTALGTFTYQFTAADAGVHKFYLTFGTLGHQTLTVTDTTTKLTGTTNVNVVTPPLPRHHHRGWWGW